VQRWLSLLAQVSASLASSLDYDMTLNQLVRLPLPTLADWCMVYVPDDGVLPARLALAHARPRQEAVLRKIWHNERSVLPEQHPIAVSLQARRPIVLSQCDRAVLETLTPAPEDAALLSKLGLRSMLVLPLPAHGTLVGALMLVSSQARRRPYDAALLGALAEFARYCAHDIYNARLFVEVRLALRLREEVLVTVRQDLLELVKGVRRPPQARADLVRWPTAAPSPRDRPRRSTRAGEIEMLAAEIEHIAQRLGDIVDKAGGAS
jgi:GAF domain-containing protein